MERERTQRKIDVIDVTVDRDRVCESNNERLGPS